MALQAPTFNLLSSSMCRPPSPLPFKRTLAASSSSNEVAVNRVICSAVVKNAHAKIEVPASITRRSANYMPNVWDYNFVQSLHTDYTEKRHVEQLQRMKEEVKAQLEKETHWMAKLEFIDAVQRLGLQYHFDMEIKKALQIIYNETKDDVGFSINLHSTTLRFRLLRQHGFEVPQGVFESFMNKTGSFKETLNNDANGLLSLYEASFHGFRGESIMDEAKTFASKHLKFIINHEDVTSCIANKISHALDLPIHWRPNRLEARWFMDVYEKDPNMNPTLLTLAKLDFNVLQSIHQKEVSQLARWWVALGVNKMNFFRDRLMEFFLWCCIIAHEPQYGTFRVRLTKITSMVTVIDDVYDIYGTMDELELLTDFIERWDITDIDKLPPAISTCFLALYNATNEVGLEILIESGFNPIPHIQKLWADQCRAYRKEARWFHEEHKPTLEEYVSNAVISVGGFLTLVCCYLFSTDQLTQDALDYVSNIPSIMHSSSLILRLNDDLGTAPHEMLRGDNPKVIECYMNETGASLEETVEHVNKMIEETWKAMNEQVVDDCRFPGMMAFIQRCLNLARASHCFYKYGDGHGAPNHETKDHILSILIQHVPMNS